MIAGMGLQKTLKLSDELNKARERQDARAEFMALWAVKNEQNFKQLKELFLRCKDVLDATTTAHFNEWEKTLQLQNKLNESFEKLRAELVKAQQNNFTGDPTTALLHLNSSPKIKEMFTDDDLQIIKDWQIKWEQKNGADLLAKIKLELERARKQGFKSDPKLVEGDIKKYKTNNTLPAILLKDFETWQAEYKKFSVAELKRNIIVLADEIKNATRKHKLANESVWLRKIKDYKLQADILNDQSIKNDEALEFLINEKWRPSKLPVLKIAVAATVLGLLLAAGIFYKDNIKAWMGSTVKEGNDVKAEFSQVEYNKLVATYDSLMKDGKGKLNAKKHTEAKVSFENAREIAEKIEKMSKPLGIKPSTFRTSEAVENMAKCVSSLPAAPPSPTPQSPAESPKNAEPKPTPEKQVVINAAEIQKKSAAEQKAAEEKSEAEKKKKAEAEKKKNAEGDKNKHTAGGNAADEYWSKVKLIGGRYRGTKEEAKALWNNRPKTDPKEEKKCYN
jgi:hypothetical protein